MSKFFSTNINPNELDASLFKNTSSIFFFFFVLGSVRVALFEAIPMTVTLMELCLNLYFIFNKK